MENKKELTQGSSLLISKLDHYNNWMARQINRLGPLSGTILDFGCGTGGFTRALLRLPNVEKVIANDNSPLVKKYFLENVADDPRIDFCDADILMNPEVLSEYKYDWAVSSNTLEHIEDDRKALSTIVEYSRLKTAIILVPALPCLYGTCDEDGGHYRRYTKTKIGELVKGTDLDVEGMFYFNMLGAIAWWFQYVLFRMRNYTEKSHSYTYSVFNDYILPVYSKLENPIKCPFGLSLVAKINKMR